MPHWGVGLLATLMLAGSFEAFPPPPAHALNAVQYFRHQGCPVRYRAETTSKYATAKKPALRRALHKWKFADLDKLRVKPPFNWRIGRSRAMRSKLHQMKYLDRLIAIADRRKIPSTMPFKRADELKALRHAVALAVDWSRAARQGRVPGADAWKQRVTGIRSSYLAYVARRAACVGKLSERQARPIRHVMRRHAHVLARRPARSTPRNHLLSINVGLAALGTYFPKDPAIRRAARKAHRRFVRSVRRGYEPRERVWLEHSPRYHLLAYRAVRSFLRKFASSSKAIRRTAHRLRSTLGRFLMPDDRLVTFGDTSGERIQDGRVRSTRRNGWWVARRSGYAIHGAPDRWFGMTAQYHARQHKHADELSFDLYESGRRLIQDSGFFHRDNTKWRRYQESSRAHSVLTVDGRDFDFKLHKRPYGSGIVASGNGDGWYVVRARNPLLLAPKRLTRAQKRRSVRYKRAARRKMRRARSFNAHHTRTFVYKPGQALIIADSVRAPRPHVYRRHFQFGPGVVVSPGPGDSLRFSRGEISGRLLSASSAAIGWINLRRGERDPVHGFVFPKTKQRRPRTAAVIGTAADDLDQVSGLFYGRSPVGAIALGGPLRGSPQLITLADARGRPLSVLEIDRNKRSIRVREREPERGLLDVLPSPAR